MGRPANRPRRSAAGVANFTVAEPVPFNPNEVRVRLLSEPVTILTGIFVTCAENPGEVRASALN
jgi:hypothetical protein